VSLKKAVCFRALTNQNLPHKTAFQKFQNRFLRRKNNEKILRAAQSKNVNAFLNITDCRCRFSKKNKLINRQVKLLKLDFIAEQGLQNR